MSVGSYQARELNHDKDHHNTYLTLICLCEPCCVVVVVVVLLLFVLALRPRPPQLRLPASDVCFFLIPSSCHLLASNLYIFAHLLAPLFSAVRTYYLLHSLSRELFTSLCQPQPPTSHKKALRLPPRVPSHRSTPSIDPTTPRPWQSFDRIAPWKGCPTVTNNCITRCAAHDAHQHILCPKVQDGGSCLPGLVGLCSRMHNHCRLDPGWRHWWCH